MNKLSLFFVVGLTLFGSAIRAEEVNLVQQDFINRAQKIDDSKIMELPIQSNGRIKPFETYARETVLFLTGKYKLFGLKATQLYLGLIITEAAKDIPMIDVRDPDLRVTLGFQKSQRMFTAEELSKSPLEQMVRPIFEKEQRNSKSVNEKEKKMMEVYHQLWTFKSIQSGQHIMGALDLDPNPAKNSQQTEAKPVQESASRYLSALAAGDAMGIARATEELMTLARNQPVPKIFERSLGTLGVEINYNHWRLFLWGAFLNLFLALFLLVQPLSRFLSRTAVMVGMLFSMGMIATGFGMRVYITGFAPVTSMYGTMLWVSLGITLFSGILFTLYNNRALVGYMLMGSGLILLLTEGMPLVLSPDMDPIVAVLRSNFWLTTHVLTITISYAAFSVAMMIGNVALVRSFFKGEDKAFIKSYAHSGYRMVQLGVFLLSAGIILGGVWADYSWGRFWGWDPKETWALIADLGFISILHARYTGWIREFGLLALSPLAYLLVIMAWYGVNFILAAGLHSYGFSSGGAALMGTFVFLQSALLIAAAIYHKMPARIAQRRAN